MSNWKKYRGMNIELVDGLYCQYTGDSLSYIEINDETEVTDFSPESDEIVVVTLDGKLVIITDYLQAIRHLPKGTEVLPIEYLVKLRRMANAMNKGTKKDEGLCSVNLIGEYYLTAEQHIAYVVSQASDSNCVDCLVVSPTGVTEVNGIELTTLKCLEYTADMPILSQTEHYGDYTLTFYDKSTTYTDIKPVQSKAIEAFLSTTNE